MTKLVPFGALLLATSVAAACGSTDPNALTGFGPFASGGSGASNSGGGDDGGASGTSTGAGSSSGGSGSSGGSSSGGSGGSSGTDAGAASPPPGSPPPPPAGAGVPCDVGAVLAAKCVACHADPPVNGSLSGLVTLADLMATAKEDPTKNEAQLSLAKMQSGAMPPASVGNPASAADIQAFQSWISGNYQGSCADASAPAPAPDVFTGAPAFVSTVASSTHNAGQNCMGGCHDHGFTFAGTLTDGNGNGVAGAEVRLVDANGKGISVHTGSNGNFHSSTSFVGPAHVGARDATNKALMVTALQPANGGCNGCHATGGTQSPIHLP